VPGQVISHNITTQNGIPVEWKRTYQGDCKIKEEFWKNGILQHTYVYAGGCDCGLPMAPYHAVDHPLTGFELYTNGTTQFAVSTNIALAKIEVWYLSAGGGVKHLVSGPIAAGNVVEMPMSLFDDGKNYMVIGFDSLNNTSTYLPVRKEGDSIVKMKLFCQWGHNDSVSLQRECVAYTGNDSVMIFRQYYDKSGDMHSGSTTVNVGIGESAMTPGNPVALLQNCPNPFTGPTKISFRVGKNSIIKLVICDFKGMEVGRLADDYFLPGTYEYTWNPSGMAAGIYFIRLISCAGVETKKIVLVK
jgi:hypothetical protein